MRIRMKISYMALLKHYTIKELFLDAILQVYNKMVTAGIIRAARAAAKEGFDALAIGCFYDTGLAEAREISGDMIVTAPCAASCEIAASLSNRFGVIVGRRVRRRRPARVVLPVPVGRYDRYR